MTKGAGIKMRKKHKDSIPISKVIGYIFLTNVKSHPIILLISMTLSLIQGLSYGIIAKQLKLFFDSVSLSISEGVMLSETLNKLVVLIVIIAIAMLINGVNNGFHTLVEGRIEETALLNLHKKSKKLTPFSFEDTKILDSLEKAREGAKASTNLLFVIMLIITFYIPSLIYLTVFFYSIYPMLALTLPIIFVPTMLNQIFRIKIFSKLADKSGSKIREIKSIENSMVGKEFYKETRMLGLFPYLYDKYKFSLDEYLKLKWDSEKKIAIKEVVLRVVSLSAYICIIMLLTYLLVNGRISEGSFAAVLSTVGVMFSTLEELIFYKIEEISSNIGYVNNYVRYMDLKEEKEEANKPINMKTEISLSNVNFSYPNEERLVLKNINLNIKSGETIAIVGMNGAGKSTLSKLIIGLYKPSGGTINYDNIEIENKNLLDICHNISGVMQNFNRYKFSLEDNIVISDLYKDKDRNKVDKALDLCEISLDKFDNGLSTILSTEFSGIDLSGGQWQRVAMARAFYKNSNILVLDEPTAAIDPEMETSIYKSIKNLSLDKTAIIVTHRLGITSDVDKIIVLDNGQIIEVGSHKELMSFNSNYRKMYLSQRKWYDFEEYENTN